MATNPLVLKIVNVLGWLFLLGSNSYASVGGSYGDFAAKTTYITPSASTFFVWTLINLTLLGEVILQFFSANCAELVVNHIGWRFVGTAVLNSVFVHLYGSGHYVLAFIVSLFLASVISHVYWSLRTHESTDLAQTLTVHLPWSLWHAWSVVLVIISAFAAFGLDTSEHAGIATKILVAVALVFLATTGVGYAFHSAQGDIAGAATIAWTLWGVFAARAHPAFIHWFALGSAIVATVAVAKALFTTSRGVTSGGERAPLLSDA